MKRNIHVVASVVVFVLLFVGVTFAMDSLNLGDIFFSDEPQEEVPLSISNASFKYNDANIDKITSFVSSFDLNNLTYEEYITIESYTNFLIKHSFAENELSVINELLKKGTPIGTIWDIYEFYLTTNDDFSIISQIASYEDRYFGKNWIENAYNDITNNKHGVINREDAAKYLESFTSDEILYANVLSRKGIYTIDEILNKHLNDESWKEITHEVYSLLPSGKLTGSEKERYDIAVYLKDEAFDYDSAPFAVYNVAFRCALANAKIDSGTVNIDNLNECRNQVNEASDALYMEQRNKIFTRLDLPEAYMTPDEYFEYNQKYMEQATQKGLDEQEIELFLRKGFSMREIAEASTAKGENHSKIVQHIKSQRGDMLK